MGGGFCVCVFVVIGFVFFNRQTEFSPLGSECYPRIYSKLVLSWQVTGCYSDTDKIFNEVALQLCSD